MNALRCRAKLISIALPIVLILFTGCGSPSTNSSTPAKSLNSISISPSNPSIAVDATERYQQSCQDSTGTNNANVASYEIFGSSAYFNGAAYLGVTPERQPKRLREGETVLITPAP